MTLNKEVLTFAAAVVLFGGLAFLGGDSTESGSRRGGRGAQDPGAVAADFTPGRFHPTDATTWSREGRNIFEAPRDKKPLPPLELPPPPMGRAALAAPPLPFATGVAAQRSLRRAFAPNPGALTSETSSAVKDDPLEAGLPPDVTGAVPEPPKALDENLTAAQRAAMSAADRIAREEARRKAALAEVKRKESLDRLTLMSGAAIYGHFAGSTEKGRTRYEVKRDFDELRRSPALGDGERAEKLKKLVLVFFEERDGRRGPRQLYEADKIGEIKFSDTPINRYHEKKAELEGRDIAAFVDALKPLVPAGENKLISDELEALRKRGQLSIESYAMLSDARFAEYEHEADLSALREAVTKFPESAGLHARLGRALLRVGLIGEAKASFTEAVSRDVGEPTANLGLGVALLREGKPAAAIAPLREAGNATNIDATRIDDARLRLGEAYLAVGDAKNAQAQVDTVLDRFKAGEDPAKAPEERRRIHRRALALASITALAQGRTPEARQAAETGLTSHPDDGPLTFALAAAAMIEGKASEAKRLLDLVPTLDPLLTARSLAAAAAVLEQAGRDAEALGAVERAATEADPSDPALRRPYGRALLNAGDAASARGRLLEALDSEPDDPDALVFLGDAAYREGALHEAVRFYDRAARLDPDYPELASRRLTVNVRRKRMDEADKLLAATNLGGKGAAFQAALAYYHYAKGNQAEALSLLQKISDPASESTKAVSDYGRRQFSALNEHAKREIWTDQFGRTGSINSRQWFSERGAGVVIGLVNQTARFEGKQGQVSDKPTYLWQDMAEGHRLVSFSVDLAFDKPMPGVYAGVGVIGFAKATAPEKWPGFQEREAGFVPFAGLQVALGPDGKLVSRKLEKARMSDWKPIVGAPEGARVLTLEFRQTNWRDGKWEVRVNREALLRDVEIPDLKNWRKKLDLQVMCHGSLGSEVAFAADNVQIVTWTGN